MPKYTETEILGDGCKLDAPTKGSFAMNMIFRRGAWEVRKGFGQFAQRCSTMALPDIADRGNTTLQKHLGSRLIKTNFDHEQIVSVFEGNANTGDTILATTLRSSRRIPIYTVQIDDLTDGTRWEVPLYQHTVSQKSDATLNISTAYEDAASYPLATMHANYETDTTYDRQRWVTTLSAGDDAFTFIETKDRVIFSHPVLGAWIYYPTKFQDVTQRTVQVTGAYWHESSRPYGESSAVSPLVMAGQGIDGGIAEGLSYLIPSDFPPPSAMAVVGNRVAYARGRTVFFSDPDYYASIFQENVIVIDSENPITAIAEQLGNLTIWTSTETFVFRIPSTGALSSGSLTKISDTVGCLNANSWVKTGNDIVWMDRNNVYRTTGNLIVSPVADVIAPFFTDFVTNPMTSYYVANGVSTPVASDSQNMPDTTLRLNDTRCHMAYSPKLDAVFAVFPEEREMWVLCNGKWAYWTVESMVHTNGAGAADVGSNLRIKSPWMVTGDDTVALVTGPLSQSHDDASAAGLDVGGTNYQVLVYGRGGSIDRSVEDEDYRIPAQNYVYLSTAGYYDSRNPLHKVTMYLDKPFKVDRGYKFKSTAAASTVINNEDVWWVPITVVFPVNTITPASGVSAWSVTLGFDNTNWKPRLDDPSAATGAIDYALPSERIAGLGGYTVTQSAANRISIAFASGGAVPVISSNEDRVNMLMYLPMQRLNDAGVRSFGFSVVTNASFTSGGTARTASVISWEQWHLGTPDMSKDDNVALPVDWCYKSQEVGLTDANLLKARGLFVRLLSHGSGVTTDYLVPAWPYGSFNTLLGSDRKGWMSQVIDTATSGAPGAEQPALELLTNKNTTRTRVRDVAGNMQLKNFVASTAAAGLHYGTVGVAGGDYIIDDQEVSIVATSDGVKGNSFSYMVFGHVQNRAQALKLESVLAQLRVVGGSRRRFGH